MLNLLVAVQHEHAVQEELFSVYVPTNHIYVGDIFLLGKEDIIHTSLSVREGLGEHTMPRSWSLCREHHCTPPEARIGMFLHMMLGL